MNTFYYLHPMEPLERRALVQPDPDLARDGEGGQEVVDGGLVAVAI